MGREDASYTAAWLWRVTLATCTKPTVLGIYRLHAREVRDIAQTNFAYSTITSKVSCNNLVHGIISIYTTWLSTLC